MRASEPRLDLASTAAARDRDTTPPDGVVATVLTRHRNRPGALLPILHEIQHAEGCIPPQAVGAIADALRLSRAEVHGVITFYPDFRSEPAGRTEVKVCRAEACLSMGGEALAEHARERLGCEWGETRADGAVTLEPVYCLGLCAQSPAVMIDGVPHARVNPARFDALVAKEGV